jgi:phosphatidate phosphatase APP1
MSRVSLAQVARPQRKFTNRVQLLAPAQLTMAALVLAVVLLAPFRSGAQVTPATPSSPDLRIVAFATTAHLDPASATWRIPVRVWVHQPEISRARRALIAALFQQRYGLTIDATNRAVFDRRINLLLADNERGYRIRVTAAGVTATLGPTSPNGHAIGTLEVPAGALGPRRDGTITLRATVSNARRSTAAAEAPVTLVGPEGISIISDIDDTVKITGVTDRATLWRTTFFAPFEVVPGIADLYRRLAADGRPVHYVSSSPWHLYEPLHEFLVASGLPVADLALKMIRLKDRTIFDITKGGSATKPQAILPLLLRFPSRRFILIGDSGEEDPEIYADLLRRYPDRIERVWIRNVTRATATDARFAKLFAGLPADKWQLFDDPTEIIWPPR